MNISIVSVVSNKFCPIGLPMMYENAVKHIQMLGSMYVEIGRPTSRPIHFGPTCYRPILT